MEEAREQVVAEVQIGAWLERFPEEGPQPQTAHVPPNPELDEQAGRSFGEILGDLRRDVEALPAAGPAPVPVSTALEKAQVVLEHVDAEGRRHPVVYRGVKAAT